MVAAAKSPDFSFTMSFYSAEEKIRIKSVFEKLEKVDEVTLKAYGF